MLLLNQIISRYNCTKSHIIRRPLLSAALILSCLQTTLTGCCLAATEQPYVTPVNISLTNNSQTSANSEQTLNLQNCFEKADENNAETIAAKYNIPIAQAGIQVAKAIPNPQFSLLYGFGPAFKAILAGNPQQFGWQEQILTAGKRTKQINLAQAKYELAQLQFASKLFSIHNRVRRAYAELAAAEAYDDLIEAQRKVAFELVNIAQARYQAGKASQSEVLQVELGVMQFDTQKNLAQLRLQRDTASLSLLIGETPKHVAIIDVDDNGIFKLSTQHTDLVPQPNCPLPPLDQLLALAEKLRADFQINIQQAFADRKALSAARSQRIPNINIDSGYQFTTFTPVQPYHLYPYLVPNSPGCYLNISAEFPIFYHYQGETDQAKAVWLQDFDQINQFKYQMSSDIVSAYEEISVARANIAKFQKDLIPAAAQAANLARRRYQVGKGDLASAILGKQQYQQILSSYFDAVVSYQNAWADLEQAMGVPLKL